MKSAHAGDERETQIKGGKQTSQCECGRNKWQDDFFLIEQKEKGGGKKSGMGFSEKEMSLHGGSFS